MLKEKMVAFRIPLKLRDKIDELLQHVYTQTGMTVHRSEFILEALYYYFDYLFKQEKEDLILKSITRGFNAKKFYRRSLSPDERHKPKLEN